MAKFIFSLLLGVAVLTTAACDSANKPGKAEEAQPSGGGTSAIGPAELKRRLKQVPESLRQSELFNTTPVPPTQIFDNMYFVGYTGVGALVITTSDGIILVDTMWTPRDAEHVIIPGIEALGLNPAAIKYILITHEHADHYGGARYLQDTYHAKVMMSETAWHSMQQTRDNLIDPFGNYSSEIPKPRSYQPIGDQADIILGDTKLTVLATPGHTPGTISLIIPVKYQGESHTVAIWGGTGLPETLEANKTYLQSLNYFESEANKRNVDASLSTHPFNNHQLEKMAALREQRAANNASDNPVIIGNKAFRKYVDQGLRAAVESKIASF